MADKNILHMVTPTKHTSPFDVNMALDAGYDAVVTYNNVTLDEITGLVQDTIFSRPPRIWIRRINSQSCVKIVSINDGRFSRYH